MRRMRMNRSLVEGIQIATPNVREVMRYGVGRVVTPKPRGTEQPSRDGRGLQGQLGLPALISASTAPGNVIQAQSTDQDGEPVTITLFAASVAQNPAGLQVALDAGAFFIASLQFGQRMSLSPPILIRVGSGVTFSCPGTAWTVTMTTNNTNLVAVGGTINRGTIPRFSGAAPLMAHTPQTANINAGSSLQFPLIVPAFATEFRIGRATINTGPWDISLQDASGNNMDVVHVSPDEFCPWIPIPPGCAQIQITNSGAVIDKVSPQFGLAF